MDEAGEPPEGNEKAVVVSTLGVLHLLCNLWVEELLLCSVVVVCKKAWGGDPVVDDMLLLELGDRMRMCKGLVIGWPRLESELDACQPSCMGSTISLTTQSMSKREKISLVRSTFCWNGIVGWYRPWIGFAAVT